MQGKGQRSRGYPRAAAGYNRPGQINASLPKQAAQIIRAMQQAGLAVYQLRDRQVFGPRNMPLTQARAGLSLKTRKAPGSAGIDNLHL